MGHVNLGSAWNQRLAEHQSQRSSSPWQLTTFSPIARRPISLSLSLLSLPPWLLIAREKIGPKCSVSSNKQFGETIVSDLIQEFPYVIATFWLQIVFFLPGSFSFLARWEEDRRNGVHIGSHNGDDRRRRPDRGLGARHGSPRRQTQQQCRCSCIIPIWSMQSWKVLILISPPPVYGSFIFSLIDLTVEDKPLVSKYRLIVKSAVYIFDLVQTV